jgi:hypothetical protein
MRSIAILPALPAVAARPDPGRNGAGEETPAVAQGRSLVLLAPPSRPDRCGCAERPRANFLAHLIATAQQAPQTRQRRRAEPASACARYAAGGAGASAPLFVGWA